MQARGQRQALGISRVLLDLAMERVAPKVRVVFLFLYPLRLGLFVARRHVTRNRFTFFARFGAFQNDSFSHG